MSGSTVKKQGYTPPVDMISVDRLRPGPGNLRGQDWPPADRDLMASIVEVGIVEPVIVTPTADAQGALTVYAVIAGHRRIAAAIAAGLEWVPAIIRRDLDEKGALVVALVENLHREDLTPLEEARGYQRLVDLGLPQKDLAARLGRSKSHVSKRLSLLKLEPAAQAYLDAGKLLVEDALAMVGMDAGQTERALHDIEALAFRRQGEVGQLIERVAEPRAKAGKAEEPDGRTSRSEQVWELTEAELVTFRELARRRIAQAAAMRKFRASAKRRSMEWDEEDLVGLIALASGDTRPKRRTGRKGGK